MQGRRAHRKSRTGCVQCKTRKVKCDERKPDCQKCEVYGVTCTYVAVERTKAANTPTRTPPSEASSTESRTRRARSPPRATNNGIPDDAVRTEPGVAEALPLFSLELLHHWTVQTSHTLSAQPAVQTMWREQAPQVGFTSAFVMHAILAVSALHLYRRRAGQRKQQCLDQAHAHHMAAMQVVAPNISRLTEEQGTAVILFSWLTCVYACGRPHTQGDTLVVGPAEWLTFLRGNKIVLDSSSDGLRLGILAPVFRNGARNSYLRRSTPVAEAQRYVARLKQFIMEDVSDPGEHGMYMDVVDLLGKSYAMVMRPEARMADTTVVLAWLFEVPDQFLDRLRRQSPPALIIYAYFCILVKKLDWMWWLEGLSEKFMAELFDALDEGYRDWLRWPSEAIGWTPVLKGH
ncbi:hypothetical protein BJX76DRAFT_368339 [Aspergillus varians]